MLCPKDNTSMHVNACFQCVRKYSSRMFGVSIFVMPRVIYHVTVDTWKEHDVIRKRFMNTFLGEPLRDVSRL